RAGSPGAHQRRKSLPTDGRVATQRSRSLIEAARVEVVLSGVESLPFPDNFFDKAQCVHVLYFWGDLEGPLHEIARVLKPVG
ncbi:methyltransferase domain-containing protein, partial [Acinetobacter baumannii]